MHFFVQISGICAKYANNVQISAPHIPPGQQKQKKNTDGTEGLQRLPNGRQAPKGATKPAGWAPFGRSGPRGRSRTPGSGSTASSCRGRCADAAAAADTKRPMLSGQGKMYGGATHAACTTRWVQTRRERGHGENKTSEKNVASRDFSFRDTFLMHSLGHL